jgi:hypothetical protein
MRQSAASQPPDGGRLGLAATPLPSLNMAADARRVRRRLAANSAVRLLLMVGVAIGALLGFAAGVAIGWSPLAHYWGHPLLALSATGDAVARLPPVGVPYARTRYEKRGIHSHVLRRGSTKGCSLSDPPEFR